jgi:hypothetical protein
MASITSSGAVREPRRSFGQILKSYFYWTYQRGSFHYDVMVTLILLFIFVTPHLWDFGAKPTPVTGLSHPIQVSGDGTHGLIITVHASDVNIPPGASDRDVKQALRRAIEPVTGDAVFVESWKTVPDPQGELEWQVLAHR